MELTKDGMQESFNYISAFHHWDEVAAVRSKPLHVLSSQESKGHLFFTPELVPIVAHPLVRERGEDLIEKILIYHLYTHLDFTENLEHEVVNKVAYQIGRGRLAFNLPMPMVADAWKLYVDEAYHYMFSADLTRQVEQVTHVAMPVIGKPRFLEDLQRLLADLPEEKEELALVFFSIVSETLISGTLSVVPKDRRVVSTVREVIADHARDEGRHHAYFTNVLNFLWERLTPEQQRFIGQLLPEFILGFLRPDYQVVKGWLRQLDFSAKEIERIIEESYPKDVVMQGVREAAKVTLRCFERNGVFEDDDTAGAFINADLIRVR